MNEPDPKRFKRITLFLQLSLLVAVGVLIWMYKTAPPPKGPNPEPPAPVEPQAAAEPAPAAPVSEAPSLESTWGLQVQGLSLTNSDTAVLLRYTVVAPEKTLLLAATNTGVYLVNQADGARLPMISPPEEGAAPQGASARTIRRMMKQAGQFPPAPARLIAGGTYSLEIPNWGRSLQVGSRVTLVVGGLSQDNLTVD